MIGSPFKHQLKCKKRQILRRMMKIGAVVHGPEIVDLGLALRPLRCEPLSLLHQSIKPLVAGYAQGSFYARLRD